MKYTMHNRGIYDHSDYCIPHPKKKDITIIENDWA